METYSEYATCYCPKCGTLNWLNYLVYVGCIECGAQLDDNEDVSMFIEAK